MRSLLPLLAALLVLAAPADLQAQARFLVYGGYHTKAGLDFEELFTDGNQEDLGEFVQGGVLLGVGAEVGVPLAALPVALKFRPSVEIALQDGIDLAEQGFPGAGAEGDFTIGQRFIQLNGDVVVEFSPPAVPVAAYVGVGIVYGNYAVVYGDDLEPDQDAFTDADGIGANLLLGARFGSGFVAPFVQARYTFLELDLDPEDDIRNDLEPDFGRGFAILAGVSLGL